MLKSILLNMLRFERAHPVTFYFLGTMVAIVMTVVAAPLWVTMAVYTQFVAKFSGLKNRLQIAGWLLILPLKALCEFPEFTRDVFEVSLDAEDLATLERLKALREHLIGFLSVSTPAVNFGDSQSAEIVTALIAQVQAIDAELGELPARLSNGWPESAMLFPDAVDTTAT